MGGRLADIPVADRGGDPCGADLARRLEPADPVTPEPLGLWVGADGGDGWRGGGEGPDAGGAGWDVVGIPKAVAGVVRETPRGKA